MYYTYKYYNQKYKFISIKKQDLRCILLPPKYEHDIYSSVSGIEETSILDHCHVPFCIKMLLQSSKCDSNPVLQYLLV